MNRLWIGVALAGLGMAGCSKAPVPYEEVRPVRTMVVAASDGATPATYAGEVRARHEAPLGFRIAGQIVARRIDLGQHVAAGQVLLQIDPKDTALQTAASQSQFERARLDYERAKQLQAKGFVSQSNVDQAKAAFDAAQSEYRLAANQGGYTVLKAEHAGVVTALNAEVGQVVAAGQALVTIADDGEREAVVSVPESRVDELRKATNLKVSLWAVPGKQYQGRLREMAVDTDPASRTYAARVTLVDADDAVRLGMTASVLLPGATQNSGFSLPLTAIYDQDGHPKVWVVDTKANRVSARDVSLGEIRDDMVRVLTGLKTGEVVVTAGAHLLHANESVRLATSQLSRP
ncbi:MAG: efflux RND transporter periplasmic adaptor subunit [Burkholderiales bacterium]|nr:efflux RND transporter periplasmic adaptor subunit [Burkholderiales bacterium]